MSSLAEIESVVAAWPRSAQQELYQFLRVHLHQEDDRPAPVRAMPRRQWLEKLAQLRAQTATGQAGSSLQEILDDLRSDR